MDGPEIESRLGEGFSGPVQTGAGTHPVSFIMHMGPFPGVKRPGCGVDHPSSTEVKERVNRLGLHDRL